jgi:beta-galactosidase GanA
MLPSARDHSPAADSAFNATVPEEAWKALPHEELTSAASWRDALGTTPAAEETFMAWHFAQYVERVVAAGKHEYNMPMFVNAALNRPGVLPGRYPSAGPLPHLREMWDAGAPSVDFLAPDIYFPNFSEWVTRYAWPGNALFVPEHNRAGRAETPADAFFAIGQLNAIGVSPFSIESADSASIAPLARAYALLRSIAPLILERQGKNETFGMRPPASYEGVVDETPRLDTLGGFVFNGTPVDPWTPRDRQDIAAHGALVLRLAPDEFLFAGSGLTFTFADSAGVDAIGIESAWEGHFENGEWRAGRLLNGDQTHQGRHVRLPPGELSLQRVRLYRYR